MHGKTIIPVILSGGCGSRLWPMSRQDRPKQFLKLINENTLFQSTILRSLSVLGITPDHVVTVTHKDLKAETIEQMLEIDAALTDHILAEPNTRNTSAALLYAAIYIQRLLDKDMLMWVLPSDYHIGDETVLRNALHTAIPHARKGEFVTFGIQPSRAETDFGYITKGQNLESDNVFKVDSFTEKPCAEEATVYSSSNAFLWNSGIYLMRTQDVIAAYESKAPKTLQMMNLALNNHANLKSPRAEYYAQIKKEPFEKTILESAKNVTVVETDPKWSDIGSWNGLWEASNKNNYGNVTEGRVICKDTTGSIIKGTNERLITCIGLKDLVISDTGDTIMIASKNSAGQLKHLVGTLQKMGNAEAMKPMTSDDGEHEFTTHTICIQKGQSYDALHNNQHDTTYIVISGVADFTLGDQCRTLNTREVVTVPANTLCSFANSSSSDLRIFEIHFDEPSDEQDENLQTSREIGTTFAA